MFSRKMSMLSDLHRTSRWVVEFDNPAVGPVYRGFLSWSEAMRYAASRRRKYGRFDAYEKPRIKRALGWRSA